MPALMQAAAAAWQVGEGLVVASPAARSPPPSVQMMPSRPHSFTTMSRSMGCTWAGVPLTAL